MQEHTERGDDLKISISGIRGTVPRGLDPDNILAFAKAFASITGNRIVIGHDARRTGPVLRNITLGALLSAGKEVIDVGLAPTPTVKAAVKLFAGHGGIMFSASHNPPEWNGFKFMGPGGFFFDKDQSARLLAAMKKNEFAAKDYRHVGSVETKDGVQSHVDAVLEMVPAAARIAKRRFRVVVDAVGGAGREALPRLLEALGCTVIPLYCEEEKSGRFPRPPEPTPAALRKFGSLMKEKRADIGFALDPDADRLVIATPKKGAIHEEYTLGFAFLGTELYHRAHTGRSRRAPGDKNLVVNLSTATVLDSLALPLGFNVVRAPVGEANVVARMKKEKARFGGEGNGGIIHSDIPSYGRDPLIGVALILSALIETGQDADGLLGRMPRLFMQKTKLARSRPLEDVAAKAVSTFPGARIDRTDGLHLILPDASWIHLRESNTEPVVRLIAQASTGAKLKDLCQRMSAIAAP